METSKKITIVGGGLVGSLLAICLKERGHQIDLFEKRFDIRKDQNLAGKSINLILTRKGIEPLKNLGLLEAVLNITTPVIGRMMHSQKGELTFQPYGRDESEKNYSVSRSDLNKLLLSEAEKRGVNLFFEDGLKNIDIDTNKANFEKTINHEFDLFFGADGAGSVTREELLRIDSSAKSQLIPLGSHYKELTMPAAADGSYQMDEKALHIWPRGNHMLMALPNSDGSFTMTLYMPEDWYQDFNNEEKVENYFSEFYPDVKNLMPNYKKEFFENPTGFLGSLDLNNWVFNHKLCLVGDAAHAIVPFFGQGMNCGFSDVQYLLDQIIINEDHWHGTFKQYQEYQKPNGDAIRDMSLDNFHEMCDHVGKDEFIFRKKVENIIEKEFPDLYRSRYAKVVYSLIPYHIAREEAAKQTKIIDQLCENISKAEEVDLKLAKDLLQKL